MGQDVKIEKCNLINEWLLVNENHDPIINNWAYQFFGYDHSLYEAHELYNLYQSKRLNPETPKGDAIV